MILHVHFSVFRAANFAFRQCFLSFSSVFTSIHSWVCVWVLRPSRSLCTVHSAVRIVHCAVCKGHGAVCKGHGAVRSAQISAHSAQCSAYSAQCSAHSALCSAHSALCTVHFLSFVFYICAPLFFYMSRVFVTVWGYDESDGVGSRVF